jgi:hypothetical protein
MSGRPNGPYTVKKRRPVQLMPYRWWKVCASSSHAIFVAAGKEKQNHREMRFKEKKQ